MTIPKPDLVALAERLVAIWRNRCWSPEDKTLLDAANALRHLASQPSLYEAGRESPRAVLDRLYKAATEELRNTSLLMSNPPQSSAAWDIRNAISREIDALPADGGEIKSSAEDGASSLPSGESEPVVTQAYPSAETIPYGAMNDDPSAPRYIATPSTAGSVREASPDDLRALGWTVACHNDYRLNGVAHTFWLLTKDERAIKGEGRSDAAALNAIRAALSVPVEAPVADSDVRWAVNYLLEQIAKKFDEWRTDDIWKSTAAETVREFKHDLIATTRPLPSLEALTLAIADADRRHPEQNKLSASFIAYLASAILTLLGGSAHG